ncbi:membrane protein [Gordonia phage Phabuloso]|nr:membrane protein [Gordonia phage Phabuloso]
MNWHEAATTAATLAALFSGLATLVLLFMLIGADRRETRRGLFAIAGTVTLCIALGALAAGMRNA